MHVHGHSFVTVLEITCVSISFLCYFSLTPLFPAIPSSPIRFMSCPHSTDQQPHPPPTTGDIRMFSESEDTDAIDQEVHNNVSMQTGVKDVKGPGSGKVYTFYLNPEIHTHHMVCTL